MGITEIRSAEDMVELTGELGFLPFFRNHIPGFSVEEHCPREIWFSDTAEGPWEWKGPAARTRRCVYGKLFRGKAGFVSPEWLPDLANYRRDGYDFDARYDDGLAAAKDRDMFLEVSAAGEIVSRELRSRLNYCREGNHGFDTVVTRLQMETYLCISDFVYDVDRKGRRYGWGVGVYSTPEHLLGYGAVTAAYSREPAESRERILEHLCRVMPGLAVRDAEKLIKA